MTIKNIFFKTPLALALSLALGCGGANRTPDDPILSPAEPVIVPNPLTLEAPRIFQAGGSPFQVQAGDLNGDGIPDLVVTERFGTTVSVLLGQGDGTFGPVNSVDMGAAPAGLQLADFNGDGHLDLVVSNRTGETVTVRLGQGNGSFGSSQSFNVGQAPQGLVAADFNGDGELDLAVTNVAADSVSLLLGQGDGTFAAAVSFDVGQNPVALTAGDLTGNGLPDLVVSNFSSNDVSILTNPGGGVFAPESRLTAGQNPFGVALADLDSDGSLDLLVANELDSTLQRFQGQGDGSFVLEQTLPTADKPDIVVVADLFGNGQPDLAVTTEDGNGVEIFPAQPGGQYGPSTLLPTGRGPVGLAVADLNGSGDLDLVTANFFGSGLTVLLNQGSGDFIAAARPFVGGEPVAVEFLNNISGGAANLGVANRQSAQLDIFGVQDQSVLSLLNSLALPAPPQNLLRGFPTPEQADDLLVANDAGTTLVRNSEVRQTVSVTGGTNRMARSQNGQLIGVLNQAENRVFLYLQSPSGLSSVGNQPVPSQTVDLAFFDVFGDGLEDLVVITQNPSRLVVFSGLPGGNFAGGQPLELSVVPSALVADRENLLLLTETALVAVEVPELRVLAPLQAGYRTGRLVDLNGDRLPELVLINPDKHLVTVARGAGIGRFDPLFDVAAGAQPWAVTATDITGNGFRDLVVVNREGADLSLILSR